MLLEHSSAAAKTLLGYHFWSYQCKEEHCENYYKERYLHLRQTNTQDQRFALLLDGLHCISAWSKGSYIYIYTHIHNLSFF